MRVHAEVRARGGWGRRVTRAVCAGLVAGLMSVGVMVTSATAVEPSSVVTMTSVGSVAFDAGAPHSVPARLAGLVPLENDSTALTIAWTLSGPSTVAAGAAATMNLSVGCSASAGAPCTAVRVDLPWGPDSNLPDPALGATAIKDWTATWTADVGVITGGGSSSSGQLNKTSTGWYLTLAQPLQPGQAINIGVSIMPPNGFVPDGTVFTVGAVASGLGVTDASASRIAVTVIAATKTFWTYGYKKDFVGIPISPAATIYNSILGQVGALRYQVGTCRLEGILPTGLTITDFTGVEWDPVTRHWSMPCPQPDQAWGQGTATNGGIVGPPVLPVPTAAIGVDFPVQISGIPVGETERVVSAVYNARVEWVNVQYPNGLFDKRSVSHLTPTPSSLVPGSIGSAASGSTAYQVPGLTYNFGSNSAGSYGWHISEVPTSSAFTFIVKDFFPCLDIPPSSVGNYVSTSNGRCSAPTFHFTGFGLNDLTDSLTYNYVRYYHADGAYREVDVAALNAATTTPNRQTILKITSGEVVTGVEFSATRVGSTVATDLWASGSWDSSLVEGDVILNTATYQANYLGDPVGVTATLTVRDLIVAQRPKASIRWRDASKKTVSPNGTLPTLGVDMEALYGSEAAANSGKLFVAYRDVSGLISPSWQLSAAQRLTWTDTAGADGDRIISTTLTQSPLGSAVWVNNYSAGVSPIATGELGQYVIEAAVGIPGVRLDSCEWLASAEWVARDDNVLLVDGAAYGAPAGTSVCVVSRTITVIGVSPGVQITKFIQGDLDSAMINDARAANISADGSGSAVYTIRVVNSGSEALKNLTTYDFLPGPGDTYLVGGSLGVARGSSVNARLAEVPTMPVGWEVAYSTAPNACAPEVTTLAGCVDNWQSTPPGELSTVRALRFRYTGSMPVGALASDISVRVTVDAYTKGRDALWNTAAIRAEPDAAGYAPDSIAPTESNRVGFGLAKAVSYEFVVQKVGPSSGAGAEIEYLAGAGFELRADSAGTPGSAVDADAFHPVDGAIGQWLATVDPGTYWLVETRAPEGYTLLAEPIRVVVDASGGVSLPEGSVAELVLDGTTSVVRITNYRVFTLPNAGGSGTAAICTLGLLGLGIGMGAVLRRYRRRAA